MFVRVIKGKSREYVCIVRGFRDAEGKVKQRVVKNLGPVTEETKEALIESGRKLALHLQAENGEVVTSGEEISETVREHWGAPKVVDALWNKFSFNEQFNSEATVQAIKLMLTERFLSPSSKLQAFNNRNKYQEFKDVRLENLYRALDVLHDNKDNLQTHIFNKQKLYGSIDVAFFDVTTLYFESKKVDDLRNFGFSKDCKFNDVQIVLSLITNSEGRPLTYEIFPGNTFEGKTLVTCLERLKQKFKINKVIIVADRGIGSHSNLEEIKKAGFEYIIGSRLRSSNKATQEEALSKKGYQPLFSDNEDSIKYKIITSNHKNDTQELLCLWSKKRSDKDRADRTRLVEKAQEMVSNGITEDKRGAKKYLSLQNKNKATAMLDQKKIDRDASFDGYYALNFSSKDLSAKEITSAYHQLWRIEESFRTMKSFFETRPMFHWKSKRISGHIMLNFISLILEVDLELTLKNKGISCTHENIRQALGGMQRSVLKIGKGVFYIYTKLDEMQKDILKTLGISLPQNSRAG